MNLFKISPKVRKLKMQHFATKHFYFGKFSLNWEVEYLPNMGKLGVFPKIMENEGKKSILDKEIGNFCLVAPEKTRTCYMCFDFFQHFSQILKIPPRAALVPLASFSKSAKAKRLSNITTHRYLYLVFIPKLI